VVAERLHGISELVAHLERLDAVNCIRVSGVINSKIVLVCKNVLIFDIGGQKMSVLADRLLCSSTIDSDRCRPG
jgi:hypothetical protein